MMMIDVLRPTDTKYNIKGNEPKSKIKQPSDMPEPRLELGW